jgi:hypothetical protein
VLYQIVTLLPNVTVNMLLTFSNEEYVDMHFVHSFWNGNANAAVEEYQ